ncbi:MAG: FAD:protein FMN transferase [Clostridia bacterium]|nr:FAD:protein FMN transferase [Clostridia bacterium]
MLKPNKAVALLLALLFVLPLFGCSMEGSYQTRYIYAMNTDVTLQINAREDVTALLDECEDLIYSIERVISKTLPDSDIYRLNHGETVDCDPITLELLRVAGDVRTVSGGLFDPTVASAVELWNRCGKENRLPTEDELAACRASIGADKIKVNGTSVTLAVGTMIDLGGIGKGYAEQAVAEHIAANAEKYGIVGYMLDFGGMVGVFGKKSDGSPYRVGLKDPDSENSRGAVRLSSGYVSVSGDYERFVTVDGKKYHHIIDPRTAYPGDNGVRAVAVICRNGARADALSTAFFLMGYEATMAVYESGEWDFEAVFFMSDGKTLTTPGADYVK